MKSFFRRRLRKSHSAHDEDRQRSASEANNISRHCGTAENGGITQSKTFDVHHSLNRTADYHSFMTEAGSSSATEDGRFNPMLDRAMMQTITDVKYFKRRPKFTAVSGANFQRECLDAHNFVRQKYGMPPLAWSQELAELAKTWAMKLADRGRILYPELPDIGENIYLTPDSSENHLTTGEELTALWAAQARDFDFDRPRWNIKSKDFSQMIWRSTVEMGVCRYWNTAKNCLSVVAFYRPAGNSNAPGEFMANTPSKEAGTQEVLEATQLEALISALNRTVTVQDAGFAA